MLWLVPVPNGWRWVRDRNTREVQAGTPCSLSLIANYCSLIQTGIHVCRQSRHISAQDQRGKDRQPGDALCSGPAFRDEVKTTTDPEDLVALKH